MRRSHAIGSAHDALLPWQLPAVAADSQRPTLVRLLQSLRAKREVSGDAKVNLAPRGTARREREPREITLQSSAAARRDPATRDTGASELRKGAPHIREQGHDVDGAAQAETGNHATRRAPTRPAPTRPAPTRANGHARVQMGTRLKGERDIRIWWTGLAREVARSGAMQ